MARKQQVDDFREQVKLAVGADGLIVPEHAWQVIYQGIMWTHLLNGHVVPHIIDKDRLDSAAEKIANPRPPRRRIGEVNGDETEGEDLNWFEAARRAADYLVAAFNLGGAGELADVLSTQSQQNTTSSKFEGLLEALLNRWLCDLVGVDGTYCKKPGVKDVRANVRGYTFHPNGGIPHPDLVVPFDDPQAVLSLKWSMRDDHISQMVAEAAELHKVRPDICVLAVTNEFDLRRLLRLANEPQILKVYHVNKKLLNIVHRPEGAPAQIVESTKSANIRRYAEANSRIFDLPDLFKDLERLVPALLGDWGTLRRRSQLVFDGLEPAAESGPVYNVGTGRARRGPRPQR